MARTASLQLFTQEIQLRDAIDAVYSLARRHVYDHGLREGDPRLQPHQRQLLDTLNAAEAELAEFRAYRMLRCSPPPRN